MSHVTTVRMPLLTVKDRKFFRSRRGDSADRTDFDFNTVYSRAGQKHEDKQCASGLVHIHRTQNICAQQQIYYHHLLRYLLPAGVAKRLPAGIVFTDGPIFGFFDPQGWHIASIKLKFGREEWTVPVVLPAKFHLDRLRCVGLWWPQNIGICP